MSRNSQALTAAQQAVVAAQVAAAEDAATAAAIPLPLTHAALVASGANVTAGTTPGTFAAGDDARITGALSATTASATYAPVVEAVWP